MRISDWSSDVCSSDLAWSEVAAPAHGGGQRPHLLRLSLEGGWGGGAWRLPPCRGARPRLHGAAAAVGGERRVAAWTAPPGPAHFPRHPRPRAEGPGASDGAVALDARLGAEHDDRW